MRSRRVWICVDRLDAKDGKVWAVRYGNRWLTGTRISIGIPTETVFRGIRSRQPKAYLAGYGVVTQHGNRLSVQVN